VINFAYGSNMLARRLQERAPSARPIGTGLLRGHALRWHKVGRDLSGKCDILSTGDPGDVVHGVLYELSLGDKPALDAAEGLGAGYEEKEVDIQTPTGVVRAHVYYATHIDPAVVPYTWYKALVVAGAQQHALPAEYISKLLAAPAGRTRQNETLLNAGSTYLKSQ
jgi:gamma-glutamylcyclotransferase